MFVKVQTFGLGLSGGSSGAKGGKKAALYQLVDGQMLHAGLLRSVPEAVNLVVTVAAAANAFIRILKQSDLVAADAVSLLPLGEALLCLRLLTVWWSPHIWAASRAWRRTAAVFCSWRPVVAATVLLLLLAGPFAAIGVELFGGQLHRCIGGGGHFFSNSTATTVSGTTSAADGELTWFPLSFIPGAPDAVSCAAAAAAGAVGARWANPYAVGFDSFPSALFALLLSGPAGGWRWLAALAADAAGPPPNTSTDANAGLLAAAVYFGLWAVSVGFLYGRLFVGVFYAECVAAWHRDSLDHYGWLPHEAQSERIRLVLAAHLHPLGLCLPLPELSEEELMEQEQDPWASSSAGRADNQMHQRCGCCSVLSRRVGGLYTSVAGIGLAGVVVLLCGSMYGQPVWLNALMAVGTFGATAALLVEAGPKLLLRWHRTPGGWLTLLILVVAGADWFGQILLNPQFEWADTSTWPRTAVVALLALKLGHRLQPVAVSPASISICRLKQWVVQLFVRPARRVQLLLDCLLSALLTALPAIGLLLVGTILFALVGLHGFGGLGLDPATGAQLQLHPADLRQAQQAGFSEPGLLQQYEAAGAAGAAALGLGFGPHAHFGDFGASLRTLSRLACGEPAAQLYSDLVYLSCIDTRTRPKADGSSGPSSSSNECGVGWVRLFFGSFQLLVAGCLVQLVLAVFVLELCQALQAADAVEAAMEPLGCWINRWLHLCAAGEHSLLPPRRCGGCVGGAAGDRMVGGGVRAARVVVLPADQLLPLLQAVPHPLGAAGAPLAPGQTEAHAGRAALLEVLHQLNLQLYTGHPDPEETAAGFGHSDADGGGLDEYYELEPLLWAAAERAALKADRATSSHLAMDLEPVRQAYATLFVDELGQKLYPRDGGGPLHGETAFEQWFADPEGFEAANEEAHLEPGGNGEGGLFDGADDASSPGVEMTDPPGTPADSHGAE